MTVRAIFSNRMKGIKSIVSKSIKPIARDILRPMIVFRNRLRFAVGTAPLAESWNDSGKPIHRYYLEQFLQEFASSIRGHCLEFQGDAYTSRFGADRVTKLDILHLTDDNPKATIVADLTKHNDIESNLFDCIICTYVLHIVYDLNKIISEMYRILRPGGSLIIAVPHIMTCYPDYHELWRFTAEGLSLLLEKAFEPNHIVTRSMGNSLTAAGELRGLVTHEFFKNELDYHDPRFGTVVCARAIKS
jgi:SAM-dependent methyltransferase